MVGSRGGAVCDRGDVLGAEAPLGVTRYATTSIANASIAWRGQLIPPWPSPRSTTNRPPRRLFSGDVATSRTCPADPVLSDSARVVQSLHQRCLQSFHQRCLEAVRLQTPHLELLLELGHLQLGCGSLWHCDTNGRVGVGAVPYESTPSSSRRDRDRDFLDGERGAISQVSPSWQWRALCSASGRSLVPRELLLGRDLTVRLTRNLSIGSPLVSLEGPATWPREDHPKPGSRAFVNSTSASRHRADASSPLEVSLTCLQSVVDTEEITNPASSA